MIKLTINRQARSNILVHLNNSNSIEMLKNRQVLSIPSSKEDHLPHVTQDKVALPPNKLLSIQIKELRFKHQFHLRI